MGHRPFDGTVRLTALREITVNGRRVERYERFACTAGLAARLIEQGSAEHHYRYDTREQRQIELALRLRRLARDMEERHAI